MIIKLLAHRYVGGALRYPDEGPISVDDEAGKALVEAGDAEDVTADFPKGLSPDADAGDKQSKGKSAE